MGNLEIASNGKLEDLAVAIEDMKKKHENELEGLMKNYNDNKQKVILDLEELNKHLVLLQANIDDFQTKNKNDFDILIKLNDEKDSKHKMNEEKMLKEVEQVKEQTALMINET